MCKKANKHLLVCGCGLELLSYFCATAFINLNIVNGEGAKGKLKSTAEPTQLPAQGNSYDAILDEETGDYYQFSEVSFVPQESIEKRRVDAQGERGLAQENGGGDKRRCREVRGEAEAAQSGHGFEDGRSA